MVIIAVVVRNDNRTLGNIDGVSVGEAVGVFVGTSVGLLVDVRVGGIDGIKLGYTQGPKEGIRDCTVLSSVNLALGSNKGVADGIV
eukprot:6818320-Ditylum_brightwellii.AAC.1